MGTAIVGGTILAAVGFVVRSMVNDRKKGGCHGGCSGCPSQRTCSVEPLNLVNIEKRS